MASRLNFIKFFGEKLSRNLREFQAKYVYLKINIYLIFLKLTSVSAICFVSGYIAIGFEPVQVFLRIVAVVWNFVTVIVMATVSAAMVVVVMVVVRRVIAIFPRDCCKK